MPSALRLKVLVHKQVRPGLQKFAHSKDKPGLIKIKFCQDGNLLLFSLFLMKSN